MCVLCFPVLSGAVVGDGWLVGEDVDQGSRGENVDQGSQFFSGPISTGLGLKLKRCMLP